MLICSYHSYIKITIDYSLNLFLIKYDLNIFLAQLKLNVYQLVGPMNPHRVTQQMVV